MNEYHKKIATDETLSKKEIWDIGNKAIQDYSQGYVNADHNNDSVKAGYFKYMIKQVSNLINSKVYN